MGVVPGQCRIEVRPFQRRKRVTGGGERFPHPPPLIHLVGRQPDQPGKIAVSSPPRIAFRPPGSAFSDHPAAVTDRLLRAADKLFFRFLDPFRLRHVGRLCFLHEWDLRQIAGRTWYSPQRGFATARPTSNPKSDNPRSEILSCTPGGAI